MEFDGAYRDYGYAQMDEAPVGLGGEYVDYEMDEPEEDPEEDDPDEDSNDSHYEVQYAAPTHRPPPPRRDDSDSDEVICLDSD